LERQSAARFPRHRRRARGLLLVPLRHLLQAGAATMKTPGKDFSDLLSGLGVAAGDLVYLHTSYRHMSYRGLSPAEILDVLTDVLGERGTLVLPSFAWNLDKTQRPWKGYADYFASRPPF